MRRKAAIKEAAGIETPNARAATRGSGSPDHPNAEDSCRGALAQGLVTRPARATSPQTPLTSNFPSNVAPSFAIVLAFGSGNGVRLVDVRDPSQAPSREIKEPAGTAWRFGDQRT